MVTAASSRPASRSTAATSSGASRLTSCSTTACRRARTRSAAARPDSVSCKASVRPGPALARRARPLMQAHGGSMELDPLTAPDKGTCFSVHLPVEAEVLEGAAR